MQFFLDRIYPLVSARHPEIELFAVGSKPPDWLKKAGEKDPRIQVTGYVEI